jgi:thiol-disulfide isomerase/thioredoxin
MITRVKPGVNSRKSPGRRAAIGVAVLIVALISLAFLTSVLRVTTANTRSSNNAAGESQIIVETALPGNVASGSESDLGSVSSSDNSASYPQTAAQSGLSSDSASGSQGVVEGATPADTSNTSQTTAVSDASASPSDLMSVIPPVQPFSLPALDGTTVSFPTGDATVFVATAPGCASCIAEVLAVSKLREEYDSRGLQVYAVDMFPNDTPEFLQPFVDWIEAEFGVDNVPWVFDEGRRFSNTFNVLYLGTTIILDADGREVYRDDVPSSEETLRNAVERAFASN